MDRARGFAFNLPKKLDGGKAGAKCDNLLTNVYRVFLPENVVVYRYDVIVTAMRGEAAEGGARRATDLVLSKASLDDYTKTERIKTCMKCFKVVKNRSRVFLDAQGEPISVFYNGVAVLYSIGKELNIAEMHDLMYEITAPGDVMERPEGFSKIQFRVRKSVDFRLELDDLTRIAQSDFGTAAGFQQFVSIITSHYVLDHHPDEHVVFGTGLSYLVHPDWYGFVQAEYPNLPEEKYVAVGSHKAAMLIDAGMAVAVDTAKTAFHKWNYVGAKASSISEELLESTRNHANVSKFDAQMKGLYVGVFHKRGDNGVPVVVRVFRVDSVIPRGAAEQTFEYEQREITVEEYYYGKYNIKLEYPNAALLVEKRKDSLSYYPMELCVVLDNQRVGIFQQTPEQLQAMRDACIMKPNVRAHSNMRNFRSLNIRDEEFEQAGLGIAMQPLTVPARVLSRPSLIPGDKRPIDPSFIKPGAWKFVSPAEFPCWGVVVLHTTGQDKALENIVTNFVGRFRSHGDRMGLTVPNFAIAEFCQPEDLEKIFDYAKNQCNIRFLLFVQNDKLTLHDKMKTFERKYELATQDLRLSTVRKVVERGQMQTLNNILAKTNVKLGGINYYVANPAVALRKDYFSGGRGLFIGISISRTPRGGAGSSMAPFVLGYSANSINNELSFVGDFLFPESKYEKENVSEELVPKALEDAVDRVLETVGSASGERAPPKEVVIYMDGISDSQYEMMFRQRMHLSRVRDALRNGGLADVSLTFIGVHHFHRMRFVHGKYGVADTMPTPPARNVEPGTVVDRDVAHPILNDFFLTSHKAFAGTASVPRYVVLANEAKMSMDELEEMTYALCFSHQIVTLSTSVPTPLYVARLYADRGRRLFKETIAGTDGYPATPNNDLCYHHTVFENKRINA